MATRMLQRRGTSNQWNSINPVLAEGELGFEIDTPLLKIGDGNTPWGELQAIQGRDFSQHPIELDEIADGVIPLPRDFSTHPVNADEIAEGLIVPPRDFTEDPIQEGELADGVIIPPRDFTVDPIATDELGDDVVTAAKIQVAELLASEAFINNLSVTDAQIENLDASKVTTGTMNAARINGGEITGITMSANLITAGTMNAARINGGEITGVSMSANLLTAGTIDAAIINVNNINANNINTGTLSANRIGAGTISSTTINLADNGVLNIGSGGSIVANDLTINQFGLRMDLGTWIGTPWTTPPVGNRISFFSKNDGDLRGYLGAAADGAVINIWGLSQLRISAGTKDSNGNAPARLTLDEAGDLAIVSQSLTTYTGVTNTRIRVAANGGSDSRFDFHLSDNTNSPLLRLFNDTNETMRMSALSNYGEIRNINASTITRHRMYDGGTHFFDGTNFVFNDTGSFSGSLTAPRFIASNTGTSGSAAFQFGNNSATGMYRNGNSITLVHQTRDVIQYGGTTGDHFFRTQYNIDRLYLGLRSGATPALNDGTIIVARSDIGGSNEISIALYGLASYTTTAGANMHITGAYNVVRSTSSGRYKKDVENIDRRNAYSLLKLGRPVWYKSKASGDGDKWSHYGLIAEEVADIDPRLVHWEYTGNTEKLVDEYEELLENADPSELRPGGVQYDRVAVMLLQVVEDHEDTIVQMQDEMKELRSLMGA